MNEMQLAEYQAQKPVYPLENFHATLLMYEDKFIH